MYFYVDSIYFVFILCLVKYKVSCTNYQVPFVNLILIRSFILNFHENYQLDFKNEVFI